MRPTDKAARSLELDASKRKVAKGKRVKLTAELTSAEAACEAGQAVTLERKRKGGGSFNEFATETTDGAGGFSLKTRVRKTTIYRAEVAESDACLPDGSANERVRVKKRR